MSYSSTANSGGPYYNEDLSVGKMSRCRFSSINHAEFRPGEQGSAQQHQTRLQDQPTSGAYSGADFGLVCPTATVVASLLSYCLAAGEAFDGRTAVVLAAPATMVFSVGPMSGADFCGPQCTPNLQLRNKQTHYLIKYALLSILCLEYRYEL